MFIWIFLYKQSFPAPQLTHPLFGQRWTSLAYTFIHSRLPIDICLFLHLFQKTKNVMETYRYKCLYITTICIAAWNIVRLEGRDRKVLDLWDYSVFDISMAKTRAGRISMDEGLEENRLRDKIVRFLAELSLFLFLL